MTALTIVAQPRHGALHLLHDSAHYAPAVGVVAFGCKSISIPHWPGFVTSVGPSSAVPSFGYVLSQCESFDVFVAGAADALPTLIASGEWGTGGEVIVGGISAERGPEAYSFRLNNSPPPGISREEAIASGFWSETLGALVKLPNVVMTPVVEPQDVIAANYEGIDADAPPDQAIWSMRKNLTMQRHMALPDGVGGIGGFATLTTVSCNGVSQRIVDRWGDKIGGTLRPGPIDWDQWHRDNPKPSRAALRVATG